MNTQIAIVGGGPVGLALALFLDHYGVRSVLINEEPTSRLEPKGSTHNARTMEHYRRLGIADRIRRQGLPADHPGDVAYFTRLNGWELGRMRMPSSAEKLAAVMCSEFDEQVPEPLHRGNQMYVERFLLEHARTRSNITWRMGWHADKFVDRGDSVELSITRLADGATENVRAHYLVGCDGGRSSIRRALGIRYQGQDGLEDAFYGGRMFATHLRAPTLYREMLGSRRAWMYWALGAKSRTAFISVNGDDEFLVFTKALQDGGLPDPAATLRSLEDCIGQVEPITVLSQRPWSAGVALTAESFGTGRVFLAGDAVHLFTPTGGFGMNTGIDDAANLSWKLAARIQGWGGTELLDSYVHERKPTAERNTHAARELAKHVGNAKLPGGMEDDSAAGEEARRTAAGILDGPGHEFASLGVQLGARYDNSPIILPDGKAPADDFVNYRPSSAPGGRAPHFWVDQRRGSGSSLFDHLGAGFTLLRLGTALADSSDLMVAAARCGVPLKVLDIEDTRARDLYGVDMVLIRPDQYVAWRGNQLPSDPTSLISRVTGRDSGAERA